MQTPKSVGYGLGGNVLDVGLYMLPSTVTMLVFSALAGRIAGRIGAAYSMAIGSVFAGLSYMSPIIGAILLLLAILYFSYRQTIAAYPNGPC